MDITPGNYLRPEEQFRAQHDRERCPLILDLIGVNSLSDAGLGELFRLQRRLRASGGVLVLCNVSDLAFQVLQGAGLAEVLRVLPADGPSCQSG